MLVTFQTQPEWLHQRFSSWRGVLVGAEPTDVTLSVTVAQPTLDVSKPLRKGLTFLMGLLLVIGLSVGAALLLPKLYFTLVPADTAPIAAESAGTPLGGAFSTPNQDEAVPAVSELPPQDPSLPEGRWLIIPRIGVRTQPADTVDPNDALAEGVWMVPGYGVVGDRTAPLILAAHRFGWEWWWRSDYWKYHSFYNLPDLQPGDLVEVIEDQRKYVYEIYAGEEGEVITDYQADLILYTCKFLNSPIRHIRYARLIDLSTNTQQVGAHF